MKCTATAWLLLLPLFLFISRRSHVDLLITAFLTSPLVGASASFGLALVFLVLLLSVWVYGGLYYSLPRLVLKWFSRRALRAL
jgi:hypothetical protein